MRACGYLDVCMHACTSVHMYVCICQFACINACLLVRMRIGIHDP